MRILCEGRANDGQEKKSHQNSHNRGCYNPASGKRKLSQRHESQAYGRRQSPKATQIHATVRQPKPKNRGTSDSEMANAFTGENDPVWLIPMLRNVFSTPSVEPLRTAKIVARE